MDNHLVEMNGSDYIEDFLFRHGVRHVFEVTGGMIAYLIDTIHRGGRIRLVSTHHEQAAAFAADGLARVTGVPSVVLATSGPGATNVLTGIASCYFDSTPALFITGQVNTDEQKGDRPIRQLGFQETDVAAMAAPITKAVHRVTSPADLPRILAEAMATTTAGRPGPVLVDVPMDVQHATVGDVPANAGYSGRSDGDPAQLEALLADFARARRPLVLAGGGVRTSGAIESFRRVIDRLGTPVVQSLMAVDTLPYDHPLRTGFIGTYGNRWANIAIGRSDFILVLGSRLDIRQTGADVEGFRADRTIYHVDCEPGEVNNRVTGCNAIIADLRWFFPALEALVRDAGLPDRSEWVDELSALRRRWPDTQELRGVSGINPNEFIHELSRSSPAAGAIVADVGSHQMWAAQSCELRESQRFITSGGLGAMGFGLPAAIGCALGLEAPVVLIAGDGGFQLNIQELETVRRNALPLKIVVLNNGCYGMLRQFQDTYFEGRYVSSLWGYSAPDFARVATAYGISACTIDRCDEIRGAMSALWNDQSQPFLLEVKIDPAANVYPKIAFGRPITEMEPFAEPIAMERS